MHDIVPALDDQPGWYRDAVFYECLIRGFRDSNGDGIGDFDGLTEQLDYLRWLGVDCIWLLPFYASPLRDGGYDISDYLSVHPQFGTLAAAERFIAEAHARGIRVLADLVVNHTSDQHEWFQASRQDRDNPKADWYVWSDDPQQWGEARIIFVDTEPSNWTWDDQRGQYYWHRFFDHQPDLNFDNPDVTAAMFEVMAFWLDRGLDGFRLDAVPYLFERDGTNGENLDETHDWLKALRAEVDRRYPGRVLLAEANQPPADVVAYFGDGDECQMAFHFPVMPMMYKALRDHQASTIVDALRETPPIPDGCQWGFFLRNHDELTLEMVTDEDRVFMLAEYAPEPGMRRNVGIGRRLFPLLDDDRRQVELLHAMLLSLPGSPVLYYGDEIGMGERMELGDRDPVRTPMQWDDTPNGGFSSASADQLYLPAIDSGPYGYAQRSVASQRNDEGSFLCWLRSMLVRRRTLALFGTGDFEIVDAGHVSVLAYRRTGEGRRVLCLFNLADTPSVAELAADTSVALEPYGWRWLDEPLDASAP